MPAGRCRGLAGKSPSGPPREPLLRLRDPLLERFLDFLRPGGLVETGEDFARIGIHDEKEAARFSLGFVKRGQSQYLGKQLRLIACPLQFFPVR